MRDIIFINIKFTDNNMYPLFVENIMDAVVVSRLLDKLEYDYDILYKSSNDNFTDNYNEFRIAYEDTYESVSNYSKLVKLTNNAISNYKEFLDRKLVELEVLRTQKVRKTLSI